LKSETCHARIVEDGTEIIRGLSLTVEVGEVAAIMGRTAPANRRCPISLPAARTMR